MPRFYLHGAKNGIAARLPTPTALTRRRDEQATQVSREATGVFPLRLAEEVFWRERLVTVSRVERLSASTESPALARSLIRSELADCDDEAVAAAELIISELVTNAVLHGSEPIELELQHEADFVRAAVTDGGAGHPVPRNPQEWDPHGRGLLIVRSLAHDWGVEKHEAAKSVWFTLPCRQAERPSPVG